MTVDPARGSHVLPTEFDMLAPCERVLQAFDRPAVARLVRRRECPRRRLDDHLVEPSLQWTVLAAGDRDPRVVVPAHPGHAPGGVEGGRMGPRHPRGEWDRTKLGPTRAAVPGRD